MTSPETVSAARAIKRECRFCSGGPQSACRTETCKLHPSVFECRSSVKRIKAHCLECAAHGSGETRHEAVRNCSGRLLRENGNGGKCWLHPFRLGKNPNRPKRTPAPSQFPKRTTDQTHFQAPESTISLPGIPEAHR